MNGLAAGTAGQHPCSGRRPPADPAVRSAGRAIDAAMPGAAGRGGRAAFAR